MNINFLFLIYLNLFEIVIKINNKLKIICKKLFKKKYVLAKY